MDSGRLVAIAALFIIVITLVWLCYHIVIINRSYIDYAISHESFQIKRKQEQVHQHATAILFLNCSVMSHRILNDETNTCLIA